MKKQHLTEGHRHEIFALLGAGKTRVEIAQALGFHTSTICHGSRPRKRLGYLSPKEKFKQLTNLDCSSVAISA